MPFVSLIIPVYNVEKYLNQCVDSVVAQNVNDIEVILVDDGSKDNSPAICDDYASKYACIKVIHKKNGGLSSARNVGIEAANGEYLMFMDSDDWWNEKVNMNEIFEYVRNNKSVEMFLLDSIDYSEDQGYLVRKDHSGFGDISSGSVVEYYDSLLQNGNLEVSACTKILKSEFVRENSLVFTSGLLGEDNEWMIRVLRVLKQVDVIDSQVYVCRVDRKDSITHTISTKNVSDLIFIVNNSLEYYEHNANDVKNKELCFCSYLWFTALGLSRSLDKQSRKNLKKEFLKTKGVCKYSNSKKTKLCYNVMKVLGIGLTSAILGKYIALKGKHDFGRSKVSQ